jgi:predicted CopG family antitoxin
MPKQSRKTGRAIARKAKKTFVLSRETVEFLEAEKEKRGGESASSVLEEIIHECRKRQGGQESDAVISAYYDSLSDEEREENKGWGEFAESQFPVD